MDRGDLLILLPLATSAVTRRRQEPSLAWVAVQLRYPRRRMLEAMQRLPPNTVPAVPT